MTAAQAAALVAALKSAHPTRRIPDATLRLYEQRLLPLDYVKASAAIGDLVDHQKFWPSIAEFLDHYGDTSSSSAGSNGAPTTTSL